MNYAAFIALVSALVAGGAMSIDLYIPSMPGMAADLAVPPGQVQLTMSVFLMGYALSQLVCGPLSDRFGRRIVLVWGLVIYLAASLACVFASGIEVLIGLRLIQSFGACAGTVIGRAVVRDRFELADAARAFGYIAMTMMLVPILAPMLGAWFEVAFGWRANFVFMAGFGLALLLATLMFLDETNHSPDAAALRPGRLAANYLTLIGNPRFMGYALSIGFSFAGVFAFVTGSAFVLMDLLKIGPGVYAAMFAITAGGYVLGSFTATRLVGRWGIDRMIALGVTIYAVFAIVLNLVALGGVFSVAAIIAPIAIISYGNGMLTPMAMAGAMEPFPRMAGVAAAMVGFLSMAGAGIGGAVVAEFYDRTQFPMILTTLVSAAALCVCYVALVRRRPAAAVSH